MDVLESPPAVDQADLSLEQYMLRALQGDRLAYEKILREIRRQMQIYLSRKVPPQDRDDIVQEILLSVHKARATYDTARPLMPWVMAIARFRLSDHWRRRYGHDFKESVDIEDMKNILSGDATKTLDTSEDIRRVMRDLPPKQQQVLNLMYRQDKTVAEIAESLKMSISAVKVTAHRGYKIFRKRFEQL